VDAVGPNLRVSNGGHTVSNVVNKQWNAVRATTGWNSGIHQWEVHVDRCISKNIFVGVMCDTCPLDNYVGSDRKGWGYLANKVRGGGLISSICTSFSRCSFVHNRIYMFASKSNFYLFVFSIFDAS
jgi:hypothetical protein